MEVGDRGHGVVPWLQDCRLETVFEQVMIRMVGLSYQIAGASSTTVDKPFPPSDFSGTMLLVSRQERYSIHLQAREARL